MYIVQLNYSSTFARFESNKEDITDGTGISRKEKLRKENYQMSSLSPSFHNYKIVVKVRISSPLQT